MNLLPIRAVLPRENEWDTNTYCSYFTRVAKDRIGLRALKDGSPLIAVAIVNALLARQHRGGKAATRSCATRASITERNVSLLH